MFLFRIRRHNVFAVIGLYQSSLKVSTEDEDMIRVIDSTIVGMSDILLLYLQRDARYSLYSRPIDINKP